MNRLIRHTSGFQTIAARHRWRVMQKDLDSVTLDSEEQTERTKQP